MLRQEKGKGNALKGKLSLINCMLYGYGLLLQVKFRLDIIDRISDQFKRGGWMDETYLSSFFLSLLNYLVQYKYNIYK